MGRRRYGAFTGHTNNVEYEYGDSMSKEMVKTAGGKLISKASKHPILVFGLGMAAGFLVYKYRKEIISSATKVVDSGKDFVLQQKETLEDIVAETKEESL